VATNTKKRTASKSKAKAKPKAKAKAAAGTKAKAAPAKPKKRRQRKPKPVGRPSKIEQHVQVIDPKTRQTKVLTVGDAVVLCLEAGSTIDQAAGAVGISSRTIYDWLARAEEHAESEKVPAGEAPFLRFSQAVTRAREGVVVLALKGILEAGKADWRALAWYLERSRPDQYGRRTRLDHGGVGGDGETLTLAEVFARAVTDPPTDTDEGGTTT
jgi:transposase-like protein